MLFSLHCKGALEFDCILSMYNERQKLKNRMLYPPAYLCLAWGKNLQVDFVEVNIVNTHAQFSSLDFDTIMMLNKQVRYMISQMNPTFKRYSSLEWRGLYSSSSSSSSGLLDRPQENCKPMAHEFQVDPGYVNYSLCKKILAFFFNRVRSSSFMEHGSPLLIRVVCSSFSPI